MSSNDKALFSKSDLQTFANDICAGEPEIFVELLGDCQNDLEDQFTNLEKARAAKNWRDFNRAAHSMKSAARTFGSPLVKNLSYELEQWTEGGIDDQHLQKLDAKVDELEKAMKGFVATLTKIAKKPDPYL